MERLKRWSDYPLNLDENQIFPPKFLQGTPQDCFFFQVRVNFQEIWWLDVVLQENLELKNGVSLPLVLPWGSVERGERDEGVWVMKLGEKECRKVALKFCAKVKS